MLHSVYYALSYVTLCYTLRYVTVCYILHCVALYYILRLLHCITHCVMLHCISHYVMLHCVTYCITYYDIGYIYVAPFLRSFCSVSVCVGVFPESGRIPPRPEPVSLSTDSRPAEHVRRLPTLRR